MIPFKSSPRQTVALPDKFITFFPYHYHRPQVTVGDIWAVQAEEWKFQLFWSVCLYSLFLFQLLVAHHILIKLSFLLNQSLRSTTHKARQFYKNYRELLIDGEGRRLVARDFFGGFLKNSEVIAMSREPVEMRSMLCLNQNLKWRWMLTLSRWPLFAPVYSSSITNKTIHEQIWTLDMISIVDAPVKN